MERMMQYIWQHRLWPPQNMVTADGRRVVVLDPGRHNDGAGPDFFNARVIIGDETWAGDVELHVRASDWHRHHHTEDPAYDSVVLHVVGRDDAPVTRRDGSGVIPQMRMPCSPAFHMTYRELVDMADRELPCVSYFTSMEAVHIRSWFDSLAYERVYHKVERIESLLLRLNGDWEQVCYVTLARAFGFGVNNDPFERLAMSVPLRILRKHSDSSLSMEAMLFGMAGLLDISPEVHDPYVDLLHREFEFLSNKFSLTPPEPLGWKMSRMRPANFPHRRIAALAAMIRGGFNLMADIAAVRSIEEARALFSMELVGYWASHFTFNSELEVPRAVIFGSASVDILVVNVVVPLLYAYSIHVDDSGRSELAMELLQRLPPENNRIVRMFTSRGIPCPDAFTSQALVELRREYCEPRKCLYCRVGHRYLSAKAKDPMADI